VNEEFRKRLEKELKKRLEESCGELEKIKDFLCYQVDDDYCNKVDYAIRCNIKFVVDAIEYIHCYFFKKDEFNALYDTKD